MLFTVNTSNAAAYILCIKMLHFGSTLVMFEGFYVQYILCRKGVPVVY